MVRFFLFVTAIYLHVILWNYSHGAMGVDVICYVYIGIPHRNHTEWVWNIFMCNIAHRNALHTE